MKFSFSAVVLLVLLGACSPSLTEIKGPPKDLVWKPEPPFLREKKVDVPTEAKALSHFLRGQILLTEGDFNKALTEYEEATKSDPSSSFLRFRLATLYLLSLIHI